jgi:hypothetical protein
MGDLSSFPPAADAGSVERAGAIKRILLRVAIFALCVTALVAIAAVLSAKLDRTEAQILLTHVAIAVYSLFALAASAVADRRPRVALAGWIVCGFGLLLALLSIWTEWSGDNDDLYRSTWVLFAIAFTIAHASLIESRRRDSDGAAVRAVSAATAATVALMGTLIAIGIATAESVDDSYLRVLGVVGVLDVLGTLVLPIARKVEQSSASTG